MLTRGQSAAFVEGEADCVLSVVVIPSLFVPGVEGDFTITATAQTLSPSSTSPPTLNVSASAPSIMETKDKTAARKGGQAGGRIAGVDAVDVDNGVNGSWNVVRGGEDSGILSVERVTHWARYPHVVEVAGTWAQRSTEDVEGRIGMGPFTKVGSAVGRVGNNRPHVSNNPCWRLRVDQAALNVRSPAIHSPPLRESGGTTWVQVDVLVLLRAVGGAHGSAVDGAEGDSISPSSDIDDMEMAAKIAGQDSARLKLGCYFMTPKGLVDLATSEGATCQENFIGKFTFTNSAVVTRRETVWLKLSPSLTSSPPQSETHGSTERNINKHHKKKHSTSAAPSQTGGAIGSTESKSKMKSTGDLETSSPAIALLEELVLMPSTWDANELSTFSLTVMTNVPVIVDEINKTSVDTLLTLWPNLRRDSGVNKSDGSGADLGGGKPSGGLFKKSKQTLGTLQNLYADL